MIRSPFLRDFLTGVTAIVATFALFAFLWRIGDLRDVGVSYYRFTLRLDQTPGLSPTSYVTLNGVRVGSIESLAPASPLSEGVDIGLRMRSDVKLPKEFGVFLDRSLIGESTLDLRVPRELTSAQMMDVVQDGDRVMGKKADTLFSQIAAAVEKPLARFDRTADSIEKLSTTLDATGAHLNELLEPRTAEDVKAGKPPNLRTTLARVDTILVSADKWLNDEEMLNDLRASADRMVKLLDEAGHAVESIDRTASSVQKQADELGPKVAALTADASETLKKIDAASTDLAAIGQSIQKGEGTLGQLVKNPDLYNSLKDASKRLDKALEELQQVLAKFKAEGIPLKL
jgi:phospholipid/cholesterol/gamma-HCH transport system substrate-binding protein